VIFLVSAILVSAASALLSPKPINCGTQGLIWTKSFNFEDFEDNYLVAVDSTTLKVVYNWTWTNSWKFLRSAYDVTSGLYVMYDGGVMLERFDSISRKFSDRISISLQYALNIFFDNQGTLWGVWFDPRHQQNFLFATIDTTNGAVDPKWDVPLGEGAFVEDRDRLDITTNTYVFMCGITSEKLVSINLDTGKYGVIVNSPLDYYGPAIHTPSHSLIGEFFDNSTLSLMDLSKGKISAQLYPNAPNLVSSYTSLYDAGTNSYIVQVLDDGPEIYYWWALDLQTKKVRTQNSAVSFLGAHLCPTKL